MGLTGAPRIGCVNIVAIARVRFDSQKLFLACSDYSIDALHFVVPFNKLLSGLRIFAVPGMKRR